MPTILFIKKQRVKAFPINKVLIAIAYQRSQRTQLAKHDITCDMRYCDRTSQLYRITSVFLKYQSMKCVNFRNAIKPEPDKRKCY